MLFRYLSLLTALTRLGSLLLCLRRLRRFSSRLSLPSARSLRGRGAHYGHGGCSDEACDDPVTFRFRFCFRCWLLGRFGFFTPLNSAFSAPKKRLNSPGCAELLVLPVQLSVLGLQQARQVSWRWRWRHIRHGKGCQRRLFGRLRSANSSSDGSAIASSCTSAACSLRLGFLPLYARAARVVRGFHLIVWHNYTAHTVLTVSMAFTAERFSFSR